MHRPSATNNLSAQVQDLHGALAWPTVVMFVVGVGGFGVSTLLAVQGSIPMWLACGINTFCLYLLFTPAHEAVHGNIRGRSSLPGALETIIGYVSAGAFLFPYPIFSYVHRSHHKHTNHPERDPDMAVAGDSIFKVVRACISMLPEYYGFYFSRKQSLLANPRERSNFYWTLVSLFVLICLLTMWIVQAGWLQPLLLWFLPALLASSFLAFIFDYLPHRPHTSQRRYLDTRVTLFPGLDVLFASQNLHLIHHLYPSIPFYHYRKAFDRLRPDLEAKGSRIVDLTTTFAPQNAKG